MKIILFAVTSLDGYIARGFEKDIYTWTSVEDQKLFFQEIEKAKLIFMGAKTYKISKHLMKHKKGRARIVFTRNPEKYKKEEVPGILEFTSDLPKTIVSKFEKKGIKEALLVGGSETNTLFLESNLISELRITIEPIVFGAGKKVFTKAYSQKLQLISSKKLNKKGTIHFRYKVLPRS